MQVWNVKQEGKMLKALKNFRGNAPVMAGLAELIEAIKVCDDPCVVGERKKGGSGTAAGRASQGPSALSQ